MEKNFLRTLAIVLWQVFLFTSCEKDSNIVTKKESKRAVFVYMIADNDLDFYATANINEMETFMAHNPEAGSVYVYIDRAKNRKTAHPILYQITADTSAKINSKIIKVYPENNSANEKVFAEALSQVQTICAINNEFLRGLVLWSHGSAWLPESVSLASQRATAVKSFGLDQTMANNENHNAEMDIRKLAIILNNYHFDFILFDACFMASIEVFYELRNTTDYIIASPTEVLATGFPYKDILTDMLSATVNYKKIAQKYVAFFQQKKGVLQSASVVTVKTAELPQFATLFKYYLNTISREITDQKWLQYSQDEVDYLFDLGQVADYLQKEQTNKELTEQLGRLITNYHHTSYFFGKIPLQKSSGISIYIPQSATLQNDEYEFYKTLSWTNAVNMPIFTKH
ncbi:clostripain-related cysteine peptidase [Capnocytophaga sputigena]|uniref:clostripain-related cysteine peptidase n=1 Tax=Capnocytophaga sputigena TaxID=1019 RepID=UPI0028E2E5EA|nr:clostripain-related cysteine peptidase [Capnocytophaga sputigena]